MSFDTAALMALVQQVQGTMHNTSTSAPAPPSYGGVYSPPPFYAGQMGAGGMSSFTGSSLYGISAVPTPVAASVAQGSNDQFAAIIAALQQTQSTPSGGGTSSTLGVMGAPPSNDSYGQTANITNSDPNAYDWYGVTVTPSGQSLYWQEWVDYFYYIGRTEAAAKHPKQFNFLYPDGYNMVQIPKHPDGVCPYVELQTKESIPTRDEKERERDKPDKERKDRHRDVRRESSRDRKRDRSRDRGDRKERDGKERGRSRDRENKDKDRERRHREDKEREKRRDEDRGKRHRDDKEKERDDRRREHSRDRNREKEKDRSERKERDGKEKGRSRDRENKEKDRERRHREDKERREKDRHGDSKRQ